MPGRRFPHVAIRIGVKVRFENDCWIYTAGDKEPRSGHMTIGYNGRTRLVHRVAWEITNGPIPDGLCVCHHCDTPRCVNPAHLFLGTQGDNTADRDAKGRQRSTRGVDHPNCRLTDEDVAAIRADYVPYKNSTFALAKKYGVHQATIWNITAGKTHRKIAWPTLANDEKGAA